MGSKKGKTRVKGHWLVMEGQTIIEPGATSTFGRASCSCGMRSPWLTSRAERKRWHAEHKDAMRGPDADA